MATCHKIYSSAQSATFDTIIQSLTKVYGDTPRPQVHSKTKLDKIKEQQKWFLEGMESHFITNLNKPELAEFKFFILIINPDKAPLNADQEALLNMAGTSFAVDPTHNAVVYAFTGDCSKKYMREIFNDTSGFLGLYHKRKPLTH